MGGAFLCLALYLASDLVAVGHGVHDVAGALPGVADDVDLAAELLERGVQAVVRRKAGGDDESVRVESLEVLGAQAAVELDLHARLGEVLFKPVYEPAGRGLVVGHVGGDLLGLFGGDERLVGLVEEVGVYGAEHGLACKDAADAAHVSADAGAYVGDLALSRLVDPLRVCQQGSPEGDGCHFALGYGLVGQLAAVERRTDAALDGLHDLLHR